MKTYYVRLWCQALGESARFLVQCETATHAEKRAKNYITDGNHWTTDTTKHIDFEHTSIIEV